MTTLHQRAAGVLLVDSAGRVLLQHRDTHAPTGANKWSLVGGGIEGDETPEDAAHRETLEETGLTITHPLILFKYYTRPHHDQPDQLVERYVFCAATNARQEDVGCYEGQAITFIAPADVFALDLYGMAAEMLRDFLASEQYRAYREQAAQEAV